MVLLQRTIKYKADGNQVSVVIVMQFKMTYMSSIGDGPDARLLISAT